MLEFTRYNVFNDVDFWIKLCIFIVTGYAAFILRYINKLIMETINKKILALIDTVYESGYKINFRDYRELSNAAVYNDCPLTQDKLKTIEHTLNNIYLFKQDSEEMVYAYLSDIVDLIEAISN